MRFHGVLHGNMASLSQLRIALCGGTGQKAVNASWHNVGILHGRLGVSLPISVLTTSLCHLGVSDEWAIAANFPVVQSKCERKL